MNRFRYRECSLGKPDSCFSHSTQINVKKIRKILVLLHYIDPLYCQPKRFRSNTHTMMQNPICPTRIQTEGGGTVYDSPTINVL